VNSLSTVPGLSDRRFILLMRQLSNRLASGGNSSIFLGTGFAFLQSRVYQPGDPIRSIDWRVMARTGHPYVKEYETQTLTPVYLVVDNSASMSRSACVESKYAVAALLAGGMAYSALAAGNPVSVMATSDRGCPRPTFRRNELTDRLRKLRYYSPSNCVQLGSALVKVRKALTSRSYIVVLSDLHDQPASKPMKSIAARHECLAVQLRDRMEVHPLPAGFVRVRAAEGGASGVVSGRPQQVSREDIGEDLRRAGVQVLRVDPDSDPVPQVQSFLRDVARRPWKERGYVS
jgi:uncharacterized protein (DUF58 family)